MAGDNDHLGFRRHGLGPGQDFQAADVVHHQIGDNNIEDLLLDLLGPLRAAAGDHALVAEASEPLAHGASMHNVVVDDEHAHQPLGSSVGRRRAGRWMGVARCWHGSDRTSGTVGRPVAGKGFPLHQQTAFWRGFSVVGRRGGAGSQIVTLVPRAGALSMSIVPP